MIAESLQPIRTILIIASNLRGYCHRIQQQYTTAMPKSYGEGQSFHPLLYAYNPEYFPDAARPAMEVLLTSCCFDPSRWVRLLVVHD
jgi:hypothetical protein